MSLSAATIDANGVSNPAVGITVHELTAAQTAQWDTFVESCPTATFFHLAGWKQVIEQAFGHRTHYLFAESDGKMRGVLPLVHIKSRLFCHALI